MNANTFLELILKADHLEKSDFLQLKKVQENFPYFQIAYVLGARFERTKQPDKKSSQLAWAALSSPDRIWLKKWLERPIEIQSGKDQVVDLLPEEPSEHIPITKRTESLKILGEKLKGTSSEEIPLSTSANPTKPKRKKPADDLIETIKRKEKKEILDSKKQEQIDLIKAFSKKEIKKATIKEIEANQNTENLAESSTKLNDNLISETFAKILIRQGKKDMAKEIYEKLSLKFPDKRAYFADLIEKLTE